MFKRNKIASGVLLALGGLAVGTTGSALAQERVDVTGSRIKTFDATSNSPITSLSSAEINATQPAAVEEVIKSLPSAVPAIGPGTNNGTGGGATIDLRGLGSNRTLVLLNGRRLVPFNLAGSVDTNSIPVGMLDRIEIVTGGASAVYGADAVTGVVNFITKKRFNGFELSGTYGTSSERDANRYRTDVVMGTSLDNGKGSAMVGLSNTRTDPLLQGQRPIGLAALSSTSGTAQGSGTDIPAQFLGLPGGLGTRQINPTTGELVAPGPGYNFNPPNYYQTPLDRQQFTALANYTVSEKLELYAEMLYTRSDVESNLAASGTFFNSYAVPIGNPFIPSAARAQLCTAFAISAANCVVGNTTPVTLAIGRRFTELGPRIQNFENKTSQYTVGAKGSLVGTWSYDAYFSRGEADQLQTRINWGSLAKVRQALDAVSTTACRNTANGCVPLNVFGPEGSITPAMLNFVNLDSLQTQVVTQEVAAVSVTGDLGGFKSPAAKSPISLAVGFENRTMEAATKSDSASQIQSEVLGTGAPTPDRKGRVELKEGFFETLIPVLEGAPFARAITLEAGLRRTSFTTSGSQSYSTSKFGGEWSPVAGVRIRAMTQKATRAPSINELYAPQVSGLSNLAVDPCQGNRINAADAGKAGTLSNLCKLTGVPDNQIGVLVAPSAGQINNLSGGNPALGPETADTKTFGVVWTPAAVPGLTLSVDRYDIDLTKAISSASTTDVLDGCYSTTRNPTLEFNSFCSLIFRSPLNGTFNGAESKGVFTALSNLGVVRTAGWDLAANYRLPLKSVGVDPKWGNVDMALNYTRVDRYRSQPTPASVDRDCNGYYSVACGAPNLKRKFIQRTNWSFGKVSLGYAWRHLGAAIEEPGGASFLPAYSEIKSFNYFDLTASVQATKNVRLNAAVTNFTNKAAPNVGNTISGTTVNSGNTFPQIYDVIGRYFTVGATVRF